MEIKLPKTPSPIPPVLENIQMGFDKEASATPSAETVLPRQTRHNEGDADVFDRETLSGLVEHTADLLSMFDRELKYEILKEAGVVQLQVIDGRDGKIVRKVPADEVIKFLKAMKEQIDDRVDVWA
jgi:uncharacterized FlaG/YvyC family protein